ncbi:hypothetical protein, partial [Pseudomonas aeruginosa]|uniref:hypothetical protein n=1 Tax=Pseudomonas aeruginosa TaxID=287 RepID=UPI0022CD6B9A
PAARQENHGAAPTSCSGSKRRSLNSLKNCLDRWVHFIETWKRNIQELGMGDYLKHQDSHVRGLCHEISTLENRCSSLQNALDDARRRPIRWGVATLIAKHLHIIGPAVLVMMAALAAYRALNGESS